MIKFLIGIANNPPTTTNTILKPILSIISILKNNNMSDILKKGVFIKVNINVIKIIKKPDI